jgi:hypothetical protein
MAVTAVQPSGLLLESKPPDARVEITDVQVSLAAHGGWNVSASVDGRVIADYHCEDWHHVERLSWTLRAARAARVM